MSEIFTKTEQAVLDLLSASLFKSEKTVDGDAVDWRSVWSESHFQTVSLTAFSGMPCQNCDEELLSVIRKNLNKTLSRSCVISREHCRLHTLMKKAGIKYTIIKGAASAAYYPDALLRSMGDVDFLVDKKDFKKADKFLCENGFGSGDSDHFCHTVYTNDICRFEMHFEPAGIPEGRAGAIIREYLEDAVECATETETAFGKINVPSVFHHGLIILLHTAHHITGEGVGLRHICDWAVFSASLSDEEFRDIFEEKLRKAGLWKFAKLLTRISSEYFGAPVKKWAGNFDSELDAAFMKDIFTGGNFGQKNTDRGHERLLISNPAKGGVGKKSMLWQFITSVNEICYTKWRITKKIKLLLPFCWLFYCGRYAVRSIMGKRPQIRLKNVIDEASSRKSLYEKIGLFAIKEKGDETQ